MSHIAKVIIALPYDGGIQTYITPSGKIAYTDCNSFEEYKLQYEARYKKPASDLVVMPWEEYGPMYDNYRHANWQEISEESYYSAFGELPPLKYRRLSPDILSFFCMEATSGAFHDVYIEHETTGKFYCARKKITIAADELLKSFLEYLQASLAIYDYDTAD